MANLTSRLVISLVDKVSGPARAMQGALAGLHGVAGRRGAVGGLGTALAAQTAVLRRNVAGTAAFSAGLGLVGRSGFEAAYGLEKVMNNVQAVGMLSDEQRASLKGYIQELNKSFPFINKEIGEAAFELFRAGFGYEQAVGALKGTLLLAQSGDIGRQEAADIATNVLTAMRLPMQTTEQAAASMARVNDTLAYAANKSNTDVRLLGETFKYVAPLASAAGMSIEQVAAAAMTMANNGIKGSEAGVAMRAAIVRMAKPTKDMLATLGRRDIDIKLSDYIKGGRAVTADDVVSGLMSSGIDASAQRKSIEAILKDKVLALKPGQLVANMVDLIAKEGEGAADKAVLADTLTDIMTASGKSYDLLGFTEALRNKGIGVAEIARIMDVRQGARILTLLLDDLKAKARDVGTNAQGAAQRMADIRMKGIVGEVARLAAAWENLWVTIGDAGVLKTIGSAFDSVATSLQNLSQSNPALLKFGTYAGMALFAIGPLGILAGGAASALRMVGAAANIAAVGTMFLGRALLFGAPAAAFGAIARGARAAAVSLALFNMSAVVGGRGALLASSLFAAGAAIKRFVGGMLSALGVGLRFAGVIGAVATAGMFIYNNLAGIGSFFEGFGDGFMKSLGPAKPVIEAIGNGLNTIFGWFEKITGPLDESGEKWKSWGETVGSAFAAPVRWLGILLEQLGKLGSAIGDSRFGQWIGRNVFGMSEGEARAAALPQLSLLPRDQVEATRGGGVPLPGASPTRGSVPSVPVTPSSSPAQSGATEIDSIKSQAQTVTATVQSSMAQVRAIIAAVDLTGEGQRIMESLAAGIRAGAPAVASATNEVAARSIRNVVRGGYSDGGR